MNKFDWRYYVKKYPDLRDKGINNKIKALEHYKKFGLIEKRFTNKLQENKISNLNVEKNNGNLISYELHNNGDSSENDKSFFNDINNNLESNFENYKNEDVTNLSYSDDGNYLNEHMLTSNINITSFGVDESNELLFCGNESLYKITSNFGDLNDDGNINILDVVSLINLVLDNSYTSNADINSDNSLNILDIVLLVNIILGD